MPPYEECTVDFLRDVLQGKKGCFPNSHLSIIKVPVLPELTAKKVYESAAKNKETAFYLPDYESKKTPNREYLFNVFDIPHQS